MIITVAVCPKYGDNIEKSGAPTALFLWGILKRYYVIKFYALCK